MRRYVADVQTAFYRSKQNCIKKIPDANTTVRGSSNELERILWTDKKTSDPWRS